MRAFLLESLEQLRDHLAAQRPLFTPQFAADSSEPSWLPLSHNTPSVAIEQPLLPAYPAKQFFFPEREILFRFDGTDFKETLPKPAPQILFGVRSCDLCAIAYQDQFFQQDPYYQARRKATLLVGIDCQLPCEGGFCPTVDAGPFVRDGMADLVCHQQGDHWLLITQTSEGEALLEGLDLKAAAEEGITQRRSQEPQVAAQFPSATHIERGIQRINQSQVPAELWQTMGLQCLSCSGCTSLCPTCSCFTSYDRPVDDGFERERCWDSCLYDAFQREASGHNPSAAAGQRVERFWFHKFSDEYIKTFGRYGCTGCGRCEKTCPGVIGVHSVMKRISATP